MTSTDTIIEILPPFDETTPITSSKQRKGFTISTTELPTHPVLNRDNTGLRNFLSDIPSNQPIGYDGEVDTIRFLGRIYNKILTFSILTRYILYILPVAILLAIPLLVFVTVAHDANIKGICLFGLFVWLEIIWCALWLAKLIAISLPHIFRLCCGVISVGTRKLYARSNGGMIYSKTKLNSIT